MRSRLFGTSLCSIPLGIGCGIVADDVGAAEALAGAACAMADTEGLSRVELRGGDDPGGAWTSRDLYVTFRRDIGPDHDANLKAIPRKQRAVVRKAVAGPLESEPTDDVDRFRRVYAESMRNLGTPMFPRRLFTELLEAFGNDCRMLMITGAGRDVAGVMSFYHRGEVLPHYGGGTEAARALRANDFMYWELMRRSADEGCTGFDYGRSKRGTGSFAFKRNWGFEPEELPYRYHLAEGRSMPDLSPTNPKYALAIRTWKRLPLPVANTIGPLVSRSLG